MGRLDGKTAIVTGAAGGLGSAIVHAFVGEGCDVVAVDIDESSLTQFVESVGQLAERVSPHVADVSMEADVQSMITKAQSSFGGLDILVNNAGLVGLEHLVGLEDLTVELWDRVLAVNLRSVMLGCKFAVPVMVRRGGGSIINTSSDSSLAGDVVNYAYAAAKAGINVLTKYVATAYGKDGIRCNAIAPGIHLKPSLLGTLSAPGNFRSDMYELLQEHCLLPRLGTPEDIANACVFFASDESSYVTAQLLQVDGGLIGHVPHLADTRRLGSTYQADEVQAS